jgi:hypothetical protein
MALVSSGCQCDLPGAEQSGLRHFEEVPKVPGEGPGAEVGSAWKAVAAGQFMPSFRRAMPGARFGVAAGLGGARVPRPAIM